MKYFCGSVLAVLLSSLVGCQAQSPDSDVSPGEVELVAQGADGSSGDATQAIEDFQEGGPDGSGAGNELIEDAEDLLQSTLEKEGLSGGEYSTEFLECGSAAGCAVCCVAGRTFCCASCGNAFACAMP